MPTISTASVSTITLLPGDFIDIHLVNLSDDIFYEVEKTGFITLHASDQKLSLPVYFCKNNRCYLLCKKIKPLENIKETVNISASKQTIFTSLTQDQQPLFIAEGNGIASSIYFAHRYRKSQALVILNFDGDIPFKLQPSKFYLPSMPAEVTANIPLLEDWGIAARICSQRELPGCYTGTPDELLNIYLAAGIEKKPSIFLACSDELCQKCISVINRQE